MAQEKKDKQGKKTGKKMSNPRITRSKEKRGCGPLGYAERLRKQKAVPNYFTTREAAMANTCNKVIKPNPRPEYRYF
jgi:hypothetical protein